MPKFQCDKKEVEDLLREICAQVTMHGGFIDDRLTIICRKGFFWIGCSEGGAGAETILYLPRKCMLPLKDFKLELDNDFIRVKYCDGLTAEQTKLLHMMVDLFNATDKISGHRKESVWNLWHCDKELLKVLLQCRDYEDMDLFKKVQSTERNEFILSDFIFSRSLLSWIGKKHDEQEFFMMPVIDCFNHHQEAFGIADVSYVQGRDGIEIRSFCPKEKGGECYINYGRFDAADTLFLHGFVDESALFVRSVPLAVQVPEAGTLQINSLIRIVNHENYPAEIRDLDYYLPKIDLDNVARTVVFSSLYIPVDPGKADALRRMLGLVINILVQDRRQAWQAVLYAERQIISENIRHYTGLLSFLESYRPAGDTELIVQNARLMAKTQLEKIRAYPFFQDAMNEFSDTEAVANHG